MVVITSYDIVSNKKRKLVTKILNGFGERVQKSVFEAILTKKQKRELIQKLKLIELDEGDSIILYTIKKIKDFKKSRLDNKVVKYQVL